MLWAETVGRRVDAITAMAAEVHGQRAMTVYGAGTESCQVRTSEGP